LRSIRSSSRAHTSSQRGFALVTALVIAALYLGLIELLLIDGTRAFHEAQRLRSRVIAATLAEDAVELAAERMVDKAGAKAGRTDAQGQIEGTYVRTAEQFELTGQATTAGVAPERATVRLQGRIVDDGATHKITIDYAIHSQ
jgi:Tfp pilus assembly protein PilX